MTGILLEQDGIVNIAPCFFQTSDHLWQCLHNYGFLRDITNKNIQLDVMREWFNAVQYQNAVRATEGKAPLAYKVLGKNTPRI